MLLAEGPEFGAHFGWVEAGVRGRRFDSLSVVFKLHICRSLEARFMLLNKEYGVLRGQMRHSTTGVLIYGVGKYRIILSSNS